MLPQNDFPEWSMTCIINLPRISCDHYHCAFTVARLNSPPPSDCVQRACRTPNTNTYKPVNRTPCELVPLCGSSLCSSSPFLTTEHDGGDSIDSWRAEGFAEPRPYKVKTGGDAPGPSITTSSVTVANVRCNELSAREFALSTSTPCCRWLRPVQCLCSSVASFS